MLWVGGAVVNKDVRYKLTTLTPLWTGGVSGRCDRLHETGIIGSLRWWYEAVVRGLGGEACDPREHKCDFKVDEFKKNAGRELYERLRIAGLCDACQVAHRLAKTVQSYPLRKGSWDYLCGSRWFILYQANGFDCKRL